MIRGHMMKLMLITSLLFSITLLGCGGGGGGDGSSQSGGTSPSPSIQVLPSTYDFGIVTTGNTTAPLYVDIINTGTATLNMSNISLLDTNNFKLNLNGGSKPCGSASPALSAGARCTLEIIFQPQSIAIFSTNLKITSNDTAKSTYNLALSGTQDDITELNVRINQVEVACPSGVVTAYVSVTDQGGYPVTVLTKDNFSIAETGGYTGLPASSPFVENNATISASLVMDYSYTITKFPYKVSDMQEGAVNFVNQMGVGDEAEIIRFSDIPIRVQDFTEDKDLLISQINSHWDTRYDTAIYDAGAMALADLNDPARQKDRKVIILISDGWDNRSGYTLTYLINHGLGYNIPFFTIGLGDSVNVADLEELAYNTGGQYYAAPTSDNIQTVYQQLADVLFTYQYILTYNSGLGTDLTVDATLGSITGSSNTKDITACGP